MTPEERLTDAIRDPVKYGIDSCLLCKGRLAMVGVFTPTEEFGKKIGQPEGKQRLIVYGLCEKCGTLPDKAERVEKELVNPKTLHNVCYQN